jgi:hypothetical protein
MNGGVPVTIDRRQFRVSFFMLNRSSGNARYESLRHSQRVLERMAPLVRFGLFAIGISVFLDQVKGLVSDAQFTWGERQVMGAVALVTIGGFALGGWVAGRLLKAAADLIEVFIAGAESAGRTADLIELSIVPALGRIAAALEGDAPPDAVPAGLRGDRARPPSAVDDLRAELEAARRADQPDRVIECRDALTEHLQGDALRALDQQVVRWLVNRVQARARGATPAGAVAAAALAARVVESFGDTPEGASLRAALPSLRRSAGLCPRCARPNTGDAALCPRCAGAGTAAPEGQGIARPEVIS